MIQSSQKEEQLSIFDQMKRSTYNTKKSIYITKVYRIFTRSTRLGQIVFISLSYEWWHDHKKVDLERKLNDTKNELTRMDCLNKCLWVFDHDFCAVFVMRVNKDLCSNAVSFYLTKGVRTKSIDIVRKNAKNYDLFFRCENA